MTKSFTAQLKDIEDLVLADMRYVAAESIQDVMEAAQTPQLGISKGATSFVEGKIPVAESELINSLTSDGTEGAESYSVAIAGFEIGDTMEFAWTAPHAMRMEVGFTGTDSLGRKFDQPGRHFVGANARRFSEFVENRVAEVRK
ncbi:MAG: hypothetical protein ABJL67_15795 [Sulfitobacter sp.]